MKFTTKAAITREEREAFFARRAAEIKGKRNMSTVLPANDGFEVLTFYSDGKSFREMRSPVVGWTARPGAVAKPILLTDMTGLMHFDNVRHARVCIVQLFRGHRIGDGKTEYDVREAIEEKHAPTLHTKALAIFAKLDATTDCKAAVEDDED